MYIYIAARPALVCAAELLLLLVVVRRGIAGAMSGAEVCVFHDVV
jgi:hypothetical protein